MIEPLPAPRRTPELPGRIDFTPSPGKGVGYLTVPPETRFTAHHAIHTEVRAETDQEAIDLAEKRFTRVLGALSLATEPEMSPPLFKTYAIGEVPPGTAPTDEITLQLFAPAVAQFGGMIVSPTDELTEIGLGGLEHMAALDPVCNELIDLWSMAESEHRLCFSPADLQQTLMDYTKVLEFLAGKVTSGLNRDTPEARAEVTTRLRTKLGASRSPDRDAKLVEAAAAELRKLRLDAIGERIRQAATDFGLTSDERKAVLATWRLRSAKAGHPSSASVTDEDIISARQAVGMFVRRYLDKTLNRIIQDTP